MAVPVYLFLGSFLLTLAFGVIRAWQDGPTSFAVTAPPPALPLTTFLLLHAFASGCTALTGIEAISNGVPAFRAPETRNANQTLIVMALLMGVLFLGSVGLTQHFAVVAGPEETILSALVRRILGPGPLYVLVQAATLAILAVAANTSFAGFPRLASIMAQDRYLPHQLSQYGDRLVFSNGMLLLAALTGVLIVLFAGDTHALIPLFAVGVFLAFTLSQAGMVVHWMRERGPGWRIKALTNGVGMATTAITLGVVTLSKFAEGAWIIVLLVPLLVLLFRRVHTHYEEMGRELTLRRKTGRTGPLASPRFVLPISGVHRGVLEAVRFARSLTDQVTAVYVEITPGAAERVRREWEQHGQGLPLEVISSPYRSIVGPLLDFLEQLDQQQADGQLVGVILPEFIPARWWQYPLHNQTAWSIKLALLYGRRTTGRGRAILDIPFYLQE